MNIHLGQVVTLPLLHALALKPDMWVETEYGAEIILRSADGAQPPWSVFPQVRRIIVPIMANLEIVHLGLAVLVRVDPEKVMSIPGEDIWYEAMMMSAVEVKSVFKDDAMSFQPETAWMWQAPMTRENRSKFPCISLLMTMEAA